LDLSPNFSPGSLHRAAAYWNNGAKTVAHCFGYWSGQLSASLYEILQILSLTMFERMPIDQLLSLQPIVVAEPFSANQLTLFD
jgi:hypothetical protein